jgi:DNA polymerase-1
METQQPFDFLLPHSPWVPPSSLPDFHPDEEIALDTENNDPDLTTKGPACLRGKGFIAGVSLASRTKSCYLPFAHHGGGNLDKGLIFAYLRDLLKQRRPWVMANAQYDLMWLRSSGLPQPSGPIWDIQIADTLLDEENPAGYSLEAIGQRWLGQGKDETLLNEASWAYGLKPKQDMWRLHSRYVGTYAETDAVRTLQIKDKQLPELEDQGLMRAMELEMRLGPILADMTLRGIRLDLDYAQKLNDRWLKEEKQVLASLRMSVDDLWTPSVVANLCQSLGVDIPKTEKGNDSLGKDYLAAQAHPALNAFLKARAINRTRSIYLEQNLLQNNYRGRIHPQFIQMACDDGGTRTYRLAAKNPNPQQIPKRSRLFDAKAIRHVFIAEDGCLWAKGDYWSQEPIIQNHYALAAKLHRAEEIQQAFRNGTKLYTFIEKETGGRCNYDQAKEVVLGRSYGMGATKMAQRMGISEEECQQILAAFDQAVPYITQLAASVRHRAADRGYIRNLLGYRRRFNLWQPKSNYGEPFTFHKALPMAEAQKKWPGQRLERAYLHKGFNALIQSGAAAQAKKAIVDAFDAGIIPTLPVHDEINSANIQSPEQAELMREIMVHAIPLRSVVKVDLDVGSSWQ